MPKIRSCVPLSSNTIPVTQTSLSKFINRPFLLVLTFRVRAEEKRCRANIFNKTKEMCEFLTHSKDEGHIAPINGVRIRYKFFKSQATYQRALSANTRL